MAGMRLYGALFWIGSKGEGSMRELIRKLTETYGPSGVEEEIRAVIRA
jgi:hypothetical protein